MSMRRATGALPLWLLCGFVAAATPAACAAGQDPVVPDADRLYRHAQADGVQLAQARYCGLQRTEFVRFAEALQHAARERALAANADFDVAENSAAMKAGFDDFRQLMATIDAQDDGHDPVQRQAHEQEQCAEVRTDIEALIGPLPKQEAKD
ncbi:hypothetical protein JR064_07640 [Xanthomonas sp. CFBP 8703]|uniref:Secreted protein n=1 Tax=Xanthomonas bonasiae TaxID=2810351 RepID=A0ABS3B0K9_9XANT|nr:hypothetical protein [Xanthomonas bonasiae]MBN6102036.1 hypothetical protein [Xanthomonas bonasiae]